MRGQNQLPATTAVQAEAPRAIPYQPAKPNPGDLSDNDWSLLSRMLSLAKQALQGQERKPEEVFSGMIAFLERYLDGKE